MENKEAELLPSNSPLWLNNFVNIYQQLSIDNLYLLEQIYHKNITFIDPVHCVEGFEQLAQYFKNLYENLSSCEFVINHVIWQESQASIYWTMSYRHPKLNKGNTVTVAGNSHIKGEADKVFYHRDYVDLGLMLYEQLPFLGAIIKHIKAKAAK